MSQLTLLALAGVAGWLVWKNFGPMPKKKDPEVTKPRATQLELDPDTGVYRPADPDDR